MNTEPQESGSPILAHYATGYEESRLESGPGQLERARTQEILTRCLPDPPAKVVDIGGGPGGYAAWLASLGYAVELLDITPLHVEQARRRFELEGLDNAHADIGDARQLPYESDSQDVALLLGPLYHLPIPEERATALRESYRVLRPGGLVVAAAISRYASLLDGFFRGLVRDPVFVGIVEDDLETGRHANPTQNPEYFTDAYFHHSQELREELEQAGFTRVDLLAIEGPFWCMQNFEEVWSTMEVRDLMLTFLRQIEREPSLIGASAHLLCLARKPPHS